MTTFARALDRLLQEQPEEHSRAARAFFLSVGLGVSGVVLAEMFDVHPSTITRDLEWARERLRWLVENEMDGGSSLPQRERATTKGRRTT